MILGDFAVRNTDSTLRNTATVESLIGCALVNDTPVMLGNGKIYRMSFANTEDEFQPTVWVGRKGRSGMLDKTTPSKWELQKKGTGAVLRNIVGTPNVSIICENDRVVGSAFKADGVLAVHLLNLADTISCDVRLASHDDLIPNFTRSAKTLPGFSVSVKIPADVSVSEIRLCTPERAKELNVPFAIERDSVNISIPGGVFSGYGMLIVD